MKLQHNHVTDNIKGPIRAERSNIKIEMALLLQPLCERAADQSVMKQIQNLFQFFQQIQMFTDCADKILQKAAKDVHIMFTQHTNPDDGILTKEEFKQFLAVSIYHHIKNTDGHSKFSAHYKPIFKLLQEFDLEEKTNRWERTLIEVGIGS